jgi:hypothetical protein
MSQLMREAGRVLLCGALLFLAGCGDSNDSGPTSRTVAYTGDYAGFLAAAPNHRLIPGDVITEANNWGGFYFELSSGVSNVSISITGAGGSAATSGAGGTGGTGEFDMAPSFLSSQFASGFWVVLGEAGRPSAGETTPISNYESFNGGGAATDWSLSENTYDYAAGGGGGSDVRLAYDGDKSDPHAAVDACATFTRFAVVGGGGGGTDNTADGGFGGGFNRSGGNGTTGGGTVGTGATTTAGGSVGGALCRGGNGPQDGTEGWAGGGGGGYYGGGASHAHDGGGGGSGYLFSDPDLLEVSTSDGTQGGNATTTLNGAFTITVE